MYLWDSTAQDWVWTKSPIPVGNNRLYAVSIVEDGEGGYTAWAVGEKDDNGFGTLVKGTITPTAVDGKASYTYTWKNVTAQYPELPQVDYYYSVQMLSPSEGWIVGGVDGEKAVILHWDGNDWSVDQEVGNDSLRGIFMLSAIEGWTVGRGGAIFYFDGTNWSAVSSPTSSMLLDVSFNKDGEGWALGFDGMLLQYKNSYWSIFDDLRSDPFDFVALDFTSNQGWLVGYHAEKSIGGQILEYDEGLWLTVSPPTDSRLNDVSVISDSDAWVLTLGWAPLVPTQV